MKTLEECLLNANTTKEAVEVYTAQFDRETKTQIAKQLKQEMEETKKTPQERKELAHKIIKIILEILLQILTAGIPIMTKGKTILKIK